MREGNMADEAAVKQRLRRAKARVARKLEKQGWTVLPFASGRYHLFAIKGKKIRYIYVDISESPGQKVIFKTLSSDVSLHLPPL